MQFAENTNIDQSLVCKTARLFTSVQNPDLHKPRSYYAPSKLNIVST